MKQLYFIKIILFSSLSFTFLSSFSQKEIDFRINLEKRTCFKVQTTLLSQVSVSTDQKVPESKNENIMVVQFNVVKKKQDFYHINFMYTDYYFKTVGVRDLIIDPKAADMVNILDVSTQIAMIINKPFSAELSQKGKINVIKENKNIAKEFKIKIKKLSPDLRKQVYFTVNSLTENKSITSLIENWTGYIPEYAVKIGDQWDVLKDSVFTHYTFVTETDTTYVIEGTGSSKKTIINEIQGMVMIINKEDDFTINIEIDKQTFLPKIITKESEALTKNEIKDYPAFSKPPTQSHTTFILKTISCQ